MKTSRPKSKQSAKIDLENRALVPRHSYLIPETRKTRETRYQLHEPSEFFEYVRIDDGSLPAADRSKIDVAVLDMNHAWPNVGHDAVVHAIVEAAADVREEIGAQKKVRIISFDVRRRNQLPDAGGRFRLYVGTGGPGHLDPRQNDGVKPHSQGITETAEWEAPLFRLFDAILGDQQSSLIAICHSFGLLCRWAGVARPELRAEKSSGMAINVLTAEAAAHPWFSQFAQHLTDRRHFRVVDNRLFDLILDSPRPIVPIAFESGRTDVLTMFELAQFADSGMPRIFGANHHPEIIDREHVRSVLQEKRANGEVDEQWYRERAGTIDELFQGDTEHQSRLTSHYSLLGPLRHQLGRLLQTG